MKKNGRSFCLSKNGIRINVYKMNENIPELNIGQLNQNISCEIDIEGQNSENEDE